MSHLCMLQILPRFQSMAITILVFFLSLYLFGCTWVSLVSCGILSVSHGTAGFRTQVL